MRILSKAGALTIASLVLGAAVVGGSGTASAGVPLKGWVNEGEPYFFESCWWQRQRAYFGGRATQHVRNIKKSCPDLQYGASAIRRPSPLPSTGQVGLTRR